MWLKVYGALGKSVLGVYSMPEFEERSDRATPDPNFESRWIKSFPRNAFKLPDRRLGNGDKV